jgi:hypothetical protein
MKSYLLSSLRKTFGEEEFRAFARSGGHHWLLWEPGGWSPPKRDNQTIMLMGGTPTTPPPTVPSSATSEALALVLAHRGPEDQVTLGRSATCELTINDGTLSQTHLVFIHDAAGLWTVRDAGSTNGSWVNGQKLAPGQPVELANGTRIQAAQVHLTHYDPEGLWERITAAQ